MGNREKFDNVFMSHLNVTADQLGEELNVMTVDCWDSVMQMTLIADLEDIFSVMFDPDDIVEFTSYTSALEIMKKLGVEL